MLTSADWCKGNTAVAFGLQKFPGSIPGSAESIRCFAPTLEPNTIAYVSSLNLFDIHLENTRALDRAFDITAKECREAIGRGDAGAVEALTKTCIFLFGARMENRLFRLLYEPTAFTDDQRSRILDGRSIEDAWVASIGEAFAARRQLRPSLVPERLNFTDRSRHDELVRLVRVELAPIITLRNVLGHGQWHRALTADRSRVDPDRMRLLRSTRLWHLTLKANLLEHLVWLLHDLALTYVAFERDFDKRWTDLQAARHRLDLDRYRQWEQMLVRRHQNGRALRRAQ